MPAPGTVLRIGELRVNPALDEIVVDGKTIKVEPRTMRLLVCLAEHPDEVMSVEQLLDEVWKDVVVSPDSVYQAIATLRRILGDDPKQPKYIANVLRRGYRLVAPVAPWVEAPAVSSEPAGVSAETPAVSAPAPAAIANRVALVALLGLFLGAGIWIFKPNPGSNSNPIGEKSVAVLPFADLSEKKDQAYFAEGLSEELIDLLSKVPGMHVPASTSSFYFKGKQATVIEIAKALGVAHVLEGSVRKSGSTIRVTAQLVRADKGFNVWSQTWDRQLSDVFKIQDEIAGAVVQTLKVSLQEPQRQRVAPTANPEAHALYLQALALERHSGADDYAAAIENLKQAVTLDPQFAAAWALMAVVLIDDLGWHDATDMLDPCAKAHQAVNEALRLDPGLSEAHGAKAGVLSICDHDLADAEAEVRRALEIDPGNARAWRAYSSMERRLKRPEQALRLAQEAIIRDPLYPWNFFPLAGAQGALGQFAAAEASYKKAVELGPTIAGLHALHANSLLAVNQPAAALAEAQREPDEQFRLMTTPFALDALGRTAEADAEIARFIEKYSGRDPLSVAEFYACRSDAARAMTWLGDKPPYADDDLPNRYGCFKKIERDPRFQALLKKTAEAH